MRYSSPLSFRYYLSTPLRQISFESLFVLTSEFGVALSPLMRGCQKGKKTLYWFEVLQILMFFHNMFTTENHLEIDQGMFHVQPGLLSS